MNRRLPVFQPAAWSSLDHDVFEERAAVWLCFSVSVLFS